MSGKGKEGVGDIKQNKNKTKGENVMKKMNNKGFSLVELIVVVLIMAIIAVALAPQVMKWVENSRKSTDCNNYDSVGSACNLALANEDVMKEIGALTSDLVLYWDAETGATWDGVTGTNFTAELKRILGDGWVNEIKVKRTTDFTAAEGATMVSHGTKSAWAITISKNGNVARTAAPASKNVS